MLVATGRREFGGSVLETALVLERRFRGHALLRDRLVFDSTFMPAQDASGFVHVWASIRGEVAITGHPPVEGPQAYVVAETEFDRVTSDALTFRSWGAPSVVLELRVPAVDVRRPIGLVHGPLVLGEPVWAAYRAVDAALVAGESIEVPLHDVLVRLAEAGVVSTDLVASMVTQEPERFVRIWEVVRRMYAAYATSASLAEISQEASLSLRQLGRDLGDLARIFGLSTDGFRDAARVIRLRVATLLLSAPDATVNEVAEAVGYGSPVAMGRAFRDANLPPPSVIQAATRYPPR